MCSIFANAVVFDRFRCFLKPSIRTMSIRASGGCDSGRDLEARPKLTGLRPRMGFGSSSATQRFSAATPACVGLSAADKSTSSRSELTPKDSGAKYTLLHPFHYENKRSEESPPSNAIT